MFDNTAVITLGAFFIMVGVGALLQYLEARRNHMSFDFGKFAHIVETVAPIVLPLVPGVPPILIPFIVHGVQVAEQIPGAVGSAKLAAAKDEVTNGIAALNAVKPGTIDPIAVDAAVTSGINTVVATANAVKSAHK